MEPLDLSLLPPGDDIPDRIISALDCNKPKAHGVVEAACRKMGHPALEWLVDLAIAEGKRPSFCVNALEMIKRLRRSLRDDEAKKLAKLLDHRSAKVRKKTIEVYDYWGGDLACAYDYFLLLPGKKRGGVTVPREYDKVARKRFLRDLMEYSSRRAKEIRQANEQAPTAS